MIGALSDRQFANSLRGVQEQLGQFNAYRNVEKPPKFMEKGNLEVLLFTLQSTMRSHNKVGNIRILRERGCGSLEAPRLWTSGPGFKCVISSPYRELSVPGCFAIWDGTVLPVGGRGIIPQKRRKLPAKKMSSSIQKFGYCSLFLLGLLYCRRRLDACTTK